MRVGWSEISAGPSMRHYGPLSSVRFPPSGAQGSGQLAAPSLSLSRSPSGCDAELVPIIGEKHPRGTAEKKSHAGVLAPLGDSGDDSSLLYVVALRPICCTLFRSSVAERGNRTVFCQLPAAACRLRALRDSSSSSGLREEQAGHAGSQYSGIGTEEFF